MEKGKNYIETVLMD